nr:MAG TPA: hypothetical protein [Caudoviricetes sp.]
MLVQKRLPNLMPLMQLFGVYYDCLQIAIYNTDGDASSDTRNAIVVFVFSSFKANTHFL